MKYNDRNKTVKETATINAIFGDKTIFLLKIEVPFTSLYAVISVSNNLQKVQKS